MVACGLLVAITWAVFGQTLRNDFVDFDDNVYVYENPRVTSGVSFGNIAWAFAHAHARNWHPLTTISHMLDCQLFGLKPAGHHFINVLLHMAAVLLLFLVLGEMTEAGHAVAGIGDAGRDPRSRLQPHGTRWPSAFVAALFAIHPLRVESVAWIAERKDVLSAVFFMLTLGAYVRYVRQRSATRYLATSIWLALGLMAKPMLVTVPLVLLLLDYWPLRREQTWPKLLAEKIPLFVLSSASSLITLLVQRGSTAIDQLPFLWRLNNAIVSYVVYLWQMIWPVNLAVFYPHPNDSLSLWQIVGALLVLAAITCSVIILRRTRPYLFIGWSWYVLMLLPVIGLVQVGEQARADRYTYLPQIGLCIAVTWLIFDLAKGWRWRRRVLATAAISVVLLLSWRASVQASYWKNSESLWSHTLAVTSNNDVAHNNLGFVLMRRGQLDDAVSHFETALKIRSQNAESHYHLGLALIHNNLANALVRERRLDEAIPHYEQAVALRPDYADAHYNFGIALLQQGRLDDAIAHWQQTVAIRPEDIEAHVTLAGTLARRGDEAEALAHYDLALQLAKAQGNAALVAKLRDKIDNYRGISPRRDQQ
jgi:tetratricopeptide (TPR) repeat protein